MRKALAALVLALPLVALARDAQEARRTPPKPDPIADARQCVADLDRVIEREKEINRQSGGAGDRQVLHDATALRMDCQRELDALLKAKR